MGAEDNLSFIFKNIIDNMQEGILTINLVGSIISVNPAAEIILEKSTSELLNKNYMEVFFEFEENDDFNQTLLDSVYESSICHNRVVPFFTGTKTKHLFLTTSFLQNGSTDGKREKVGVIAVFSDISELAELRDTVTAMERIQILNSELTKRNEFIRLAFGRYLSDEIVAELLNEPDKLKLGGEKKAATILMADIRGFTSFSENIAPEHVVAMLNNYFGVMTEIILDCQGTILDFIGDAILAVFGAPVWYSDHAEKAVFCAVNMQLAMQRVNQWNQQRNFPDIAIGIGIHSGSIILGNIGSEKKVKYSAIGAHVNLAFRIESYTVGNQILASEDTTRTMALPLVTAGQITISPKGLKAPLQVHDIIGIAEPYNLFLRAGQCENSFVPVFLPVSISLIADKNCVKSDSPGEIVEICQKEAILQWDHHIDLLEKIKLSLDLSGEHSGQDVVAHLTEVYGMTKSCENVDGLQKYRIEFTWVPQEFKDFIAGLASNQTFSAKC